MPPTKDPPLPLIEPHLLWPHLPEAAQQTLRQLLLQICQTLLQSPHNLQEKTHEPDPHP